MSRVVPAILTDDAAALEKMLRQAERFTSYFQLDVMDGRFVPSRSVAWKDIAALKPRIEWEAHLMVMEPGEQLEDFKQAGARRAVFHYEATQSPREVIARARKLGLEVGIAINPETPVSAFLPLIKDVDSVLFLSVNPGFYGSQFIPEVLDKVRELRKKKPRAEIGIDGGIKEDNIARAAATGADIICVGSAIFRHPNPEEAYHRLSSLAGQAGGVFG